ncbi:MAG: N-acetylmuramoyl-L-alanine amidase [Anaerolineae bacterium]|nr:N-acetylmuramoyl-L-alanine amidase [Anaerolineae bacterium]
MEYSSPVGDQPTSRYFPETGCLVEGAFLNFFDHYGVDLCGLPLSNRVVEAGIPTQYFQRLALEEPAPGQVRLKAIGDEVLRLRQDQLAPPGPTSPLASNRLLGPVPFGLINQTDRLPRHPTARYPTRPLEYIRHLIIHHTGVPASVGPEVIAGYHVTDLNWPGIGYHFVVDAAGQVYQTNALTTAAYHARQFNGSGVGIALLGNFTQAVPPAAQLDAVAELCAWLLRGLDLPPDAIKGHREMIAVTCPGEYWLQGPHWKASLVGRVARLLRGEPMAEPAPITAVPRVAATPWAAPVETATPPMLPPLAAAMASAPSIAATTEMEQAPAATPVIAKTEPPAQEGTTDQGAPLAPLAPTTWAESAEQSVATAAMASSLTPLPAPDASHAEATTDTTPTSEATSTPATRPWWMPIDEPFPTPEPPAAGSAAAVTDTVPLDVALPNETVTTSDNGVDAGPPTTDEAPPGTPAQAQMSRVQPEAAQTDDEDVPFFPRRRSDHFDAA